MRRATISKICSNELSTLLYLCHEHTEFKGLIAYDTAEKAKEFIDSLMESFETKPFPGVREISWNANSGGSIKFFNNSSIVITYLNRYNESEKFHRVLYDSSIRNWYKIFPKSIIRYEIDVNDLFAVNNTDNPADTDKERDKEALDEFLESFKISF